MNRPELLTILATEVEAWPDTNSATYPHLPPTWCWAFDGAGEGYARKSEHCAIYQWDWLARRASMNSATHCTETQPMAGSEQDGAQNDAINPDHYKVGGIETIDYMRAKATPEEFRGHLRLTAIKYLSRAGHKDELLKEYRKAAWYLDRLIKELEE